MATAGLAPHTPGFGNVGFDTPGYGLSTQVGDNSPSPGNGDGSVGVGLNRKSNNDLQQDLDDEEDED